MNDRHRPYLSQRIIRHIRPMTPVLRPPRPMSKAEFISRHVTVGQVALIFFALGCLFTLFVFFLCAISVKG